MRLLNGSELAGFIKERQARQVRQLKQVSGTHPKLQLILANNSLASKKFVELKQFYGQEILVDVSVTECDQKDVSSLIKKFNQDEMSHGIVLQLPLSDPNQTDELCSLIDPRKDVDGLGKSAKYESASALAIIWLLAGYNINLARKKIVVAGQGRLVGAPLTKLLSESGYEVSAIDIDTQNKQELIAQADVLISATGQPRSINEQDIKNGAVVVDAGTADVDGQIVGDLAEQVYERQDLTITPKLGGVGPLTISALFDNLIRAASSFLK